MQVITSFDFSVFIRRTVVVWFDGTNTHASDLVIANRLAPSDLCQYAGGVCPDVGNVIASE
jgi:hypothetical protein